MPIVDDAFKIPVTGADGANMTHRGFSIVVAEDSAHGIGKDGKLPWDVPEDLTHFRVVTSAVPASLAAEKRNAVLMGRKTYDGIPARVRPLPGRLNVVLTRQEAPLPGEGEHENLLVIRGDIDAALRVLAQPPYATSIYRVFLIGGADLFKMAAAPALRPFLQTVYLTKIKGASHDCDVVFDTAEAFAPLVPEGSAPQVLSDRAEVHTLVPKNYDEAAYLQLIERIVEGRVKEDRTGVGTHSLFGAQMRFNMRDGRFPLLTTKRVFWKGVCEELLWFLRGETDSKLLEAKGVNIWAPNGSREFLDGRGLTQNAVGDLGPVYGFQWRHFGAPYSAAGANYDGQGVDQIKRIVHTLRTNPNDRRLLLSAWNPAALDHMALPPCHVLAQFYVDTDRGELSCMLYQRSCDMGLGVPFNIASYALLTVLLCRATGLKPGDFVHTLGDAHVYKNHVDPLKEQLKRVPRAFPFLHVKRDRAFLEDYQLEDFEIVDYFPYPTIAMQMAV